MKLAARLSPIERQYLTQVSREIAHQDTPDLKDASQKAADLLRLTPQQQFKISRLLDTWTDPVVDARQFTAQLKVEGYCSDKGLNEPNLLLKVAGLSHLIKGAPDEVPSGAELPGCFTSAGWEECFVRLTKDFTGIEGNAEHAREYLNPVGKKMVDTLIGLGNVEQRQAELGRPLRVLNLCSGEGGEARDLARMGCQVDAVDVSQLASAVNQRRNEEEGLDANINVVCGDIAKIPLDPPDRYDLIIFPDGDGVHYQEDRQKLFDRLAHVASDGCQIVGSFYVPGKDTPPEMTAAFDKGMTWAGFTPSGVNADSYEAGLQEAGFKPAAREQKLDSMIRTDVDGFDVPGAYYQWHERVIENQKAQGRNDKWLASDWMKPAADAPNGFGFIIDAVIRK